MARICGMDMGPAGWLPGLLPRSRFGNKDAMEVGGEPKAWVKAGVWPRMRFVSGHSTVTISTRIKLNIAADCTLGISCFLPSVFK